MTFSQKTSWARDVRLMKYVMNVLNRSSLVSTIASRELLSFQARLKTVKLDDDVTLGGRLLQTCAAATGKARPPMVARRIRGMMSSAFDAERSRC